MNQPNDFTCGPATVLLSCTACFVRNHSAADCTWLEIAPGQPTYRIGLYTRMRDSTNVFMRWCFSLLLYASYSGPLHVTAGPVPHVGRSRLSCITSATAIPVFAIPSTVRQATVQDNMNVKSIVFVVIAAVVSSSGLVLCQTCQGNRFCKGATVPPQTETDCKPMLPDMAAFDLCCDNECIVRRSGH